MESREHKYIGDPNLGLALVKILLNGYSDQIDLFENISLL
jgi:hypothetical protein